MTTRRDILKTGTGLVAACSVGHTVGFAAENTDTASAKREKKTSRPKSKRLPLRLHLVGCGYPPPYGSGDRTRHGSAFLLEVGAELLMVDCGPGTTYKMARMGIQTTRVSHVFLTHHHFDHNVDFPCFALVRWDLCDGTEPPLKVYGPPPTQAFVEQLLGEKGAFFPDWHSRVTAPVSIQIFKNRGGTPPRPAPAFDTRDVGPGKVEENASWTVTAARVHHLEPTLVSLAYRFDTDRGSVVFAGDCGDCPELRKLAQGADTLVVPCVSVGNARRYHSVIMGTDEVREIAKMAQVRRVVLTHNGSANSPEKRRPFIQAVKEVFPGDVLFPDELTTTDLLQG